MLVLAVAVNSIAFGLANGIAIVTTSCVFTDACVVTTALFTTIAA